MKRLILPLEGQPRRPFFCSGFWEGAEYRLYFDRGSQPEQDSLQEKGMRGAGLPEESGGFMNNPGWATPTR